jgi:hypothetical protein
MLGEISFDTVVPEAGLENIEGCYRLEDGGWRVFYLTHRRAGRRECREPDILPEARFSSGILGIDAAYPSEVILNKSAVKALLSAILGGVAWTEVCGPDSLTLK